MRGSYETPPWALAYPEDAALGTGCRKPLWEFSAALAALVGRGLAHGIHGGLLLLRDDRSGNVTQRGDVAPVRFINRILRKHLGIMVVPEPPSAKMLHEHANVSESHHPARGGNTVVWMRSVAKMVHDTDTGPCERRWCEDCPGSR